MTLWWGRSAWPSNEYRASICEDDRDRIPAPLGERCYLCDEVIIESDQGTAMMAMLGGYDGIPVTTKEIYEHRECGMRHILGCSGHLMKEGHSHHVPYREDARRVMKWLAQQRD